ncbi:MAG: protoporphyrinogen oxidase [Betaproteobacteria bacterium]|nr:protoporphyrinogen oxidase [Betaproteobacteria bacterium]
MDTPTASFDVLVIGAGISGLTVAHTLQSAGADVGVVDAGDAPGGVIATRERDGFLYETGANSALDTSPLIDRLFADVGVLGERRDAGAVGSKRFIVRGGKLVALPTSPGAFLATSAFTLGAKLRLLREPFVAPAAAGAEESIADFVRRRLGNEFLDYAIDPFVSGIYAGDPERISVPAAFPRLHALEQKYGSLIRGQIRGAKERRQRGEASKNAAKSFSFARGMDTPARAIARRLLRCETGVRVTSVTRGRDAFAVEGMRRGERVRYAARSVVVSAAAHAAAPMFDASAPALSRALAAVEYAPVCVVASAFRRADVAHPLDGFGVLVPKKERRRILGTLFSSSLFEGRAPPGHALLTTFAGGRRNPDLAALDDGALLRAVSGDLEGLLGARNALWHEIVRWPQAIPQYTIGHLARIAAVDAAAAALPGLHFCANWRGGVAFGDCIKNGVELAERLRSTLAAPVPAA